MSDAFIAAIPGALATIIAGALGAYAVLRKEKSTPIPSPDNTVAENDLLAAAALKSKKHYRRFALLVAGAGLLLGAVVLVIGLSVGASQQERQQERQQEAKLNSQVVNESKSNSDLIARAIASRKAYLLPSIVMIVSVEKSADGSSVIEDQRTIYQIQALKDIQSTRNDQADLFPEEYDSRHAIKRIPGSDKEMVRDLDFPNKWFERFDLADGQSESIVTGVEHTRPFKEQIAGGLCMFPNIGLSEECFCYPNDQEDVIGQVMIIVQSKSLNLNAEGAAQAMLKRANGTLEPVTATTWTLGDGSIVPSTVVARFADVKARDIAGIKVRWGGQ